MCNFYGTLAVYLYKTHEQTHTLMKTIATITAQAIAGTTATLVGLTPQIVDSVSMAEGLRLMKMVGGVSNARAIMDYSNANQDLLAIVAVACAFGIVRTIAKKVA